MDYRQQQEGLRNRTNTNVDNKDKKTYGKKGKSIFDFSSFEKPPTFYNVIEGYNFLDVLPFIIKSKYHPQEFKPGQIDYVIEVYVHSGIGLLNNHYICLEKTFGRPCFVCQERQRLIKEEKKNWKEPEVSALNCSRKVLHNVLDLKNLDKGIQLFYASYAYFEKELLDAVNDYKIKKNLTMAPLFADLLEGKSISFKASAEKWGEIPYFKYKNFTLEDRTQAFDPSILEMTIPLDSILYIPTYDEVKTAFYDVEGEQEENEKTSDTSIEQNKQREQPPLPSVINQFMRPIETPLKQEGTMGIIDEVKNEKEAIQQLNHTDDDNCPNKHIFAKDCDTKPECINCPKWEACSDKQIEMKKAARKALNK